MSAKNSIAPTTQSKLDVGKALMLRLSRGLTYAEIGAKFGVTKQAAQTALTKYQAIFNNPVDLQSFKKSKADILESILEVICFDLLDPAKRQAASLNNLAYTLTQLNTAIRLERGQSSANNALVIHVDFGRPPEPILPSEPALATDIQSLDLPADIPTAPVDIPLDIDRGTLYQADPPTPDHLDTSTSLNYNIPFSDVDLVKGG